MNLFKTINFDIQTLQAKEEIVINVMLEANSIVHNKNNDNLINLFESVSSFKYDRSLFSEVNTIRDYFGNKYAYLKDVTNLFENSLPKSSLLFDSELTDYNNDFKNYLNELSKINDFVKYDDSIIKTKLFAKTKLEVLGFNIFDIDLLKAHIGGDIFAIVYSLQHLIFVSPNQLVRYSIEKNTFESKSIQSTPENYLSNFNQHTDKILYGPTPNLKYTDNLFRDNARLKFIEKIKMQQNFNKLFK